MVKYYKYCQNNNMCHFVLVTCIALVVICQITSTNAAPAPAPMDVYDILDGDQLFARMAELIDALGAAGDADVHFAPKKREQPTLSSGRPTAATEMQERCRLPVRKGVCRALIPRWSFDPSTGVCREFKFGGCDGNGNNFETQRHCEEACRS